MIITLIGFRGSGKSSVGPLLAERLGMSFIDTDRQIEQQTRQSIAEIFAEQGEKYFREVEAKMLQTIYQQENQVVATGGGAVLNPQTQLLIQQKGPAIWLQADVETTLKRIQKDQATAASRPALTNLDFRQEVVTLLNQREPIYRSLSDIRIDTDNATPEQIVEDILPQLATSDWRNR